MPSYRLLSWNVNGLRAAGRKGFVEWLSREKADVVCVQETKAEPAQLPEELKAVPGYGFECVFAEKKGYSGVGTYARRAPAGIERGLGVPEYDREGRVLVHRFPEFTLFNVYFPNGKKDAVRLAYKLRFYEDLRRELARRLKKGEKNLVVCGDVNTAHKEIDLSRPKENAGVSGFLPEERAWIDRLLSDGFLDAFREFEKGPGHYTWWDLLTRARERNVGWRLDYFFVSEALKPHLKRAVLRPEVLGSDHCPVELELSF
ncbi:MAG TPA: exodeoxyribonuclease III [Elusimicrobia bacterium]|nr:exodeoxyribonuclease III [Elusimicrobiota bacterium]